MKMAMKENLKQFAFVVTLGVTFYVLFCNLGCNYISNLRTKQNRGPPDSGADKLPPRFLSETAAKDKLVGKERDDNYRYRSSRRQYLKGNPEIHKGSAQMYHDSTFQSLAD